MTKRDFQKMEYVAEATEQQTSQVGNGPDRLAMNPDVQSAAIIAKLRAKATRARTDAKSWAEGMAKAYSIHVQNTPFYRDAMAFDRVLRWLDELSEAIKAAQVRHEAERVAAD